MIRDDGKPHGDRDREVGLRLIRKNKASTNEMEANQIGFSLLPS